MTVKPKMLTVINPRLELWTVVVKGPRVDALDAVGALDRTGMKSPREVFPARGPNMMGQMKATEDEVVQWFTDSTARMAAEDGVMPPGGLLWFHKHSGSRAPAPAVSLNLLHWMRSLSPMAAVWRQHSQQAKER
jgi:hypothetical protein